MLVCLHVLTFAFIHSCGECKLSIHAILAKAPLRTFTSAITASKPLSSESKTIKESKEVLSAAHPRPLPPAPLSSPVKALLGQEPTSPDALYFGAGGRKRRPSGLMGIGRVGHAKRPFLSLRSVQTQSAIPELQEKGKKEESWLEMVDDA